jgi:ATP-dependent DNA helicase RecQ
MDLAMALQHYFGFREFREPQEEVITEIMAGRDVFVVMPTGGGKSLCYQLPAMLFGGVTVVVSPLIALMKDQVDRLSQQGLAAAAINSSLSLVDQQKTVGRMSNGELKLVYVAPERFRSQVFLRLLRGVKLSLFAVDEAHCLSQWGHDFRPDYFRLGGIIQELGRPQVAAFTATATPPVRADILERLQLRDPRTFVAGFARPNLKFRVCAVAGERDKFARLRELIGRGRAGIVYCATRKRVEQVAQSVRSWKVSAEIYHGGLDDQERVLAQNRFAAGETDVVVATNAFGMGIDRADLRFVVHFELPGSLEAYYQEAGRAGRDGEPAECELLFNYADTEIQEFFIKGNNPPAQLIQGLYVFLKQHVDQSGQLAMPVQDMADRLGVDNEMSVRSALTVLERSAVIQRSDVPGSRVRRTKLLQMVDPKALPIDHQALKEKENRDRAKLKSLLNYAYSRRCRQATILDYFGDPEAHACVTCDNCLNGRSIHQRQPTETEQIVVRKILSGIARMSHRTAHGFKPRFGRTRVVQVLAGSKATELSDLRLDRLSTYGILNEYSDAYLHEMVMELQTAGLVDVVEGAFPVIGLTSLGVEVMRGRAEFELVWPEIRRRRRAR